MTESLDPRIRKRLAGVCQDCSAPAGDSDYCEKHYAMAKARDRKARRKERRRRAEQGLCRDGCGRRVSKKRRAGGVLMQIRCPSCRKRHSAEQKERRDRRGVDGSDRGVIGNDADPSFDQWRPDASAPDGSVWNRYRGKGRRGRLTKAETAEEHKRDINAAIAKLVRLRDKSIPLLLTDDVSHLPRFQREEAKRQAMDPGAQAVRLVIGVLWAHGVEVDIPDEIDHAEP